MCLVLGNARVCGFGVDFRQLERMHQDSRQDQAQSFGRPYLVHSMLRGSVRFGPRLVQGNY